MRKERGIYGEINTNPTPLDRLKLAAVWLVCFGGIGAYEYFVVHDFRAAKWLWLVAVASSCACAVPGLGRAVYVAWMGLGATIGLFTQPIVLAVVYFVVFVPCGLMLRLFGRDLLKKKFRVKGASYWEDYEEKDDPVSYFGQY
jgi:hypothetical protein